MNQETPIREERAMMRDALEAVLLFHSGGEWTVEKQERWAELTDDRDPTTRGLCNHIRAVLGRGEMSDEEGEWPGEP